MTSIGPPIPLMVERVRLWLSWGMTVRVLTARLALGPQRCLVTGRDVPPEEICAAIAAWTLEHIGTALEATCVKDWRMIELWDDRAVQVISNTGRTLAEEHEAQRQAERGAP